MRSDHDALLRAVIDAPDDDAPRLIYADWCEENGDPERAEFIRLQIEFERGSGRRRAHLQARLDELSLYEDRWTVEFDEVVRPDAEHPCRFRRGFVEELELAASSFARHAGWLFARTPLTSILIPHQPDVGDLIGCDPLRRLRGLTVACDAPCEPGSLLRLLASPALRTIVQLSFVGDPDGHRDWFPRYPDQAGEVLAGNSHLSGLRELRFHGVESRGLWEPARAAWIGQLTRLEATRCSIRCESVYQLTEVADLRALKVLNLAENRIGDDGLRALAETKKLDGIEVLDVRSQCERVNTWDFDLDDDDPPSPETIQLLKKRFGQRVRV